MNKPPAAIAGLPTIARPLKPQRVWFVVLLALFVVWFGLMLWMYFATVYPMRHHAQEANDDIRPDPRPLPGTAARP